MRNFIFGGIRAECEATAIVVRINYKNKTVSKSGAEI